MNKLSEITIALCMDSSEKNDTAKPLTNAEFYELTSAVGHYNGSDGHSVQLSLFEDFNQIKNFDLINLRDVDVTFLVNDLKLKKGLAEKIILLLPRINSLAFEIERLEKQAIYVCTVYDKNYPAKLKDGLKSMPHSLREPPLIYYCGDLSLSDFDFAGFVGSRDVNESDVIWTREAIKKIKSKAENENKIFGIVSGGAEGIDKVSEDTAIDLVMPVIEYSKSMRTTLKDSKYLNAVMEEKMVLISEVNPLRNFSRLEATAHFMNRNKYIYATADYTVVVKSSVGLKSGTWAGASEALKRKIGRVFVRDIEYEGNQGLINMGAKPLPN